MTGISTRYLVCFSFLSLPASFGLFRGFSRVVERQVLAWRMASSLEVGGLEEDREQLRDKEEALWLLQGRIDGKEQML